VTDAFEAGPATTRFEGAVISVAEQEFTAPDGHVFVREIVHHPGAVAVVPVDASLRVVLIRQYRSAIGTELLEIPAGKRDVAGEAPETTAKRELIEEVGLVAGRLTLLARFHNSPGFCDEYSHLYLATELVETRHERTGPEEQHLTVELVDLAAAVTMIADGDIVDAKTIIGVLLARDHLIP
jgi:ADP-ribose pyrophosphatase